MGGKFREVNELIDFVYFSGFVIVAAWTYIRFLWT